VKGIIIATRQVNPKQHLSYALFFHIMHFHEPTNPRNLAQNTCDGASFVLQYNISMSIKKKSYVFKLNVMLNKPNMMQNIIKVFHNV